MIRHIGLYLIGLVISLFFLKGVLVFINTRIFGADLASIYVNDYLQLVFRVFLAYIFGAAYFFFKIQRLEIRVTTKQVIYSIIGLILMFIVIDFVQFLIILKILPGKRAFTHSILPLWLTFPCIILYFGVLLKYGLKKNEIKWFW